MDKQVSIRTMTVVDRQDFMRGFEKLASTGTLSAGAHTPRRRSVLGWAPRHLVLLFGAMVLVAIAGCQEPSASIQLSIAPLPSGGITFSTFELPSFGRDRRSGMDGRSDVDSATRGITLAGAANETVTFCFTLGGLNAPLAGPELEMTSLKGTGAALDPAVCHLYRLQAVDIATWPGWHVRDIPPGHRNESPLDVLVPIRAPRGGLPRVLRPGETYHFWADVTIPKGTFDGTYSGRLVFKSEGREMAHVPIQLTVWPILLPDEPRITLLGELDHHRLFREHVTLHGQPHDPIRDNWLHDPKKDELDGVLRATMRMLHDHGVTAVLPRLTPLVSMQPSGQLTVHWEQYDAVVEPLLSGEAFFDRRPLRYWLLPLPFDDPNPTLGHSADAAARSLDVITKACTDHFRGRGWLSSAYALPPSPRDTPPVFDARARRFASVVKHASERVAVVSRAFPQDPRPTGWTDYPFVDARDSVDVWMPPAQFYDVAAMAAERDAGRRTWMRVDRPPYSGSIAIQAPASATRALTWQARQLGCEVIDLGELNAWPDELSAPSPADCIASDPNVLIYPGTAFGLRQPVPSVRLKRLRRAMQDAAYGLILAQRNLGHIESALARALCPYAGTGAYRTHFADGKTWAWPSRERSFDEARRIMADSLVASASSGTDRTNPRLQTMHWRRFMEEVARLELSVDGVRVRFGSSAASHHGAAAPHVQLECVMTLANLSRAPLEGTLAFGPLPPGVEATDSVGRPLDIEAGATSRVQLLADATNLPCDASGHLDLPISVHSDRRPAPPVAARVSYIRARTARGPVVIDGDLSDWPIAAGHVAGDFRLITGASHDPDDPWRTTPAGATTVFVMRDADALYIAANCQGDAVDTATLPRRNTLVYDDLIPMGSDLIEILIDPFNSGTRSPADLYHIVIKRSGPAIAEKGLRRERRYSVDPPDAAAVVGSSQPWPVQLDYAVSAPAPTPHGGLTAVWTVELRLPLADFSTDGAPTTHAIWGFNVTRNDTARQEFSTWSGAVGNAYDPLSLGNLHLP